MCICLCNYEYVRAFLCVYVYIYIYIYIGMCIYIYICVCVCVCVYVCNLKTAIPLLVDMADLLNITLTVLNRINATYMLYAGSLIGSYRHHDIIPWDDDIDLFIDNSLVPYTRSSHAHSVNIGPIQAHTCVITS